MAANPTGDVIEETIVVNATEAMEAIAKLQEEGQSLEATIKELATTINATAKDMGVEVDTVSAKFEKLLTGVGLFGKFGDKAGFSEVNNELKDMAAASESAASGGLHLFSAQQLLNTVMGTFVAMGVFQVIQAISMAWSESSKAADEYYTSLRNINAAQSTMAALGNATTTQDMLDMAKEIGKEWNTVADVDMLNVVASANQMAASYGLSREQMRQLVEMAVTLSNLHGGLPVDYVDNILKGAAGTNALWANQMGIAATAQDVTAEAKRMGLVAQDFNGTLTDQQKIIAGLSLEWQKLGPQVASAQAEQNSAAEAGQRQASTWKNLLTEMGKYFTPFRNDLAEIVDWIGNKLIAAFKLAEIGGAELSAHLMSAFDAVGESLKGNFAPLFHQGVSQWDLDTFNKHFNDIYGAMQTGGITPSNAPVNPNAPDLTAGGSATIAQASDISSVQSAYQSYYDSMEKAAQSFDNKMQDLQDSYNLRVKNEVDNTNLRIMQTEADYNLRREQEAQNFQNKMKDMQDQYLLDLEGALRKRDAEAVINIIEKYKMQTDEAKRQQALQTKQEAEQEKLRIEQMKQEEKLRLQQMQAEYELQRSQAIRDYAQQQQDLAKSLDEKLQEEAVKLAQKYNLNQGAADKLYGLFKEYYGPDGLMASKQQAGYLAMEQNTANMIAQMQIYINQYAAMMSAIGGGIYSEGGLAGRGATIPGTNIGEGGQGGYGFPSPPSGGGGSTKRARGGIDLAQTATTVTYGEAGPELAMFLPLNASQGKALAMSGFGGGGGGGGGQAMIEVLLSPDLEARVVNNTLNAAAITIKKVYGAR